MNGRRKMEHQSREIERLRDENKELQSELNVMDRELERKERAIAKLTEENKGLRERFEDVYAEVIEDSKKLNEARLFYREAAKSAMQVEHDYKELIAQLGIELKYTVKGGV